jgi:hypothetical protein
LFFHKLKKKLVILLIATKVGQLHMRHCHPKG